MADHGLTATFATARTAAMAATLGLAAAGAVTVVAGVYEATPLKRRLGAWIVLAPWSVPGLMPLTM